MKHVSKSLTVLAAMAALSGAANSSNPFVAGGDPSTSDLQSKVVDLERSLSELRQEFEIQHQLPSVSQSTLDTPEANSERTNYNVKVLGELGGNCLVKKTFVDGRTEVTTVDSEKDCKSSVLSTAVD